MGPPPWRCFSRSYASILPSSLTRVLPYAYAFSACPPVSVYGTVPRSMSLGIVSRHDGYARFAFPWEGSLPAHLRARICLCPSPARRFDRDYRPPAASRPMLHPIGPAGGAGMRLPLPWKPQASGGGGSHPSLRYSCLHSLFHPVHDGSRRRFFRTWNAPLPTHICVCRSFGAVLSPVELSAPDYSTSELLRTL